MQLKFAALEYIGIWGIGEGWEWFENWGFPAEVKWSFKEEINNIIIVWETWKLGAKLLQ